MPRSTARPRRNTTTCLKHTRRDATRLNEFGLLANDPYDDLDAWRAQQPLEIRWYDSEPSLSEALRRTDERRSRDSNVVVVLSEAARSALRLLIRRTPRGGRLVLIPGPYWPSPTTSLGDLALAAPSLGWESIERHFTLREAIASARDSWNTRDPVVVLLPSETRRQRPLM
jgi:hypothetical protein